jgi:hypothetical protein
VTISSACGFYARPMRKIDLQECLMLQPKHIGDEGIGRDRAIRIWQQLACNPLCASSVAESPVPLGGRSLVAFGFDAPVANWFVEEEITHPRKGLNSRFMAKIAAGDPVLLTWEETAAMNAGAGVDFIILCSSCLPGMNASQIAELSSVLAPTYLEARRGYKVNRIIIEAIGPEEQLHFESTHMFQRVAIYEDDCALWVSAHPSKEPSAMASFVSPLFYYREPIFRLRSNEQELLLAALGGKTDEELSDELALSVTAIKKRWVSIFERTTEGRPDLFELEPDKSGQRRGRQKRHHVLAYVRNHPEELRPYLWK